MKEYFRTITAAVLLHSKKIKSLLGAVLRDSMSRVCRIKYRFITFEQHGASLEESNAAVASPQYIRFDRPQNRILNLSSQK